MALHSDEVTHTVRGGGVGERNPPLKVSNTSPLASVLKAPVTNKTFYPRQQIAVGGRGTWISKTSL